MSTRKSTSRCTGSGEGNNATVNATVNAGLLALPSLGSLAFSGAFSKLNPVANVNDQKLPYAEKAMQEELKLVGAGSQPVGTCVLSLS